MQNTKEAEARTSSDPIFSSSTKLHDANYSSSINIGEIQDDNDDKPLGKMERFKLAVKYMRPMIVMLFFDVGLPFAIYYILKIWLSVLIALILSGVPPLLRVFYVFWKRRQIDILGCIFVVSFILSAVLSIISGDVRLTLLRDSVTTAIISIMFFVTLIPLETKWFKIRPLIYLFTQQMMVESPPVIWTDEIGEEHKVERMEWIWKHCSIFRKYCYILCAIWGFVLMGEFIAKVIMVKSSLTVDQILLYGNIIIIVIVATMTIGTVITSRIIRKKIVIILKQWLEKNNYALQK